MRPSGRTPSPHRKGGTFAHEVAEWRTSLEHVDDILILPAAGAYQDQAWSVYAQLRSQLAPEIENQKVILANQEQIKENQGIIQKNQEKLDIIIRNQEQILASFKK